MMTFDPTKLTESECKNGKSIIEQEMISASRIFGSMVSLAKIPSLIPSDYVLWDISDAERVPPCPGVYVAFCERGVCHYVGSSICVGERVGSPGTRDELASARYMGFIPIEDERERLRAELYLIAILDPCFSRQLKPPVSGRVRAVRADLDWNAEYRAFSVIGSTVVMRRDGKVVKS